MADQIHFIITGGTIDSYYNPITGSTLPYEHSTIPHFIPILKLHEESVFTEVLMKDSRDITPADREKILRAIEGHPSKRVIVTHGSYTVGDTAKYLQKKMQKTDKTIIFVCSMIPLHGISPTDAGFNLGYAVAKSQDLTPGIYVCVNGRVFDPKEIVKILSDGRFDSIYKK
jgi:L-asparaginase